MGRTFGLMGVDWEQRVNFERLRVARLDRIKGLLRASELGSLVCFDPNNIRYITSTLIGTWSNDKFVRWSLLMQDREPIMWDFGSAARHHQIYCPWLDTRSRAGITNFRGGIRPEAGRAEDVAHKIKVELEQAGLVNDPVGLDIVEPPIMFALQKEGLNVIDGQQLMLQARMIKSDDELILLDTACMMVDAAYEELYKVMGPGMKENEHPHIYSDRVMRPGDPVFFDILHAYNGYRTCYYRTFAIASASKALVDAYARCRYYLDDAISRVKPGATTAEIAEAFPRAQEFGFPNEEAAFALQLGHGVGLSIWEKPVISRLIAPEHADVIEEGMVFALETYWPAPDGSQAARIEEQLIVTKTGSEVITRFPAEQLLVAGQRYQTVEGALPTMRERQSNLNRADGLLKEGVKPNGADRPRAGSPEPAGRKRSGGDAESPKERLRRQARTRRSPR
ncbi:MAG: aminopeptidase P family protein [Chloroflexi bacterium]|nr:MAG: aminopeptidase P family protein [Chloroflexota bacterium]